MDGTTFNRFQTPIRSAIKGCAGEAADLGLDRISPEFAAQYVDDDVVASFWEFQSKYACDGEHWRDLYAGLDLQTRRALWAAIDHGHPAAARILQVATVKHVATWLAGEAATFRDDNEPTDDERYAISVAADVDDPVRRDLRLLAKEVA